LRNRDPEKGIGGGAYNRKNGSDRGMNLENKKKKARSTKRRWWSWQENLGDSKKRGWGKVHGEKTTKPSQPKGRKNSQFDRRKHVGKTGEKKDRYGE